MRDGYGEKIPHYIIPIIPHFSDLYKSMDCLHIYEFVSDIRDWAWVSDLVHTYFLFTNKFSSSIPREGIKFGLIKIWVKVNIESQTLDD